MGLALVALLAACRTEDRREEAVGVERGRAPQAQPAPPAATAEQQAERAATARLLGTIYAMSQGEIEKGRLALQKAVSAEVKSFAARLVADHQQDVDQIDQLAQRKGLDVHGALSADPILRAQQEAHRQAMDSLRGQSGEAFEVSFTRPQPDDHALLGQIARQGSATSNDADIDAFFAKVEAEAKDHQALALRALPVACGGTLAAPGGGAPQGGAPATPGGTQGAAPQGGTPQGASPQGGSQQGASPQQQGGTQQQQGGTSPREPR
jgi:putative membrane protein